MYFTIAVTVKWLLQRDNKNTTFLVCFYWSMCMHRLGRACTVWDVRAPFGTCMHRLGRAPPPTPLHLLMERQHHVREASELEQNEEDELAGEVLPQELTGAAVVKLLLRLGPLHGVHHQIHQLVLQNRTPLLVLQERTEEHLTQTRTTANTPVTGPVKPFIHESYHSSVHHIQASTSTLVH